MSSADNSYSNTLIIVMDSVRYREASEVGFEEIVTDYGGKVYTQAKSPSIWSLPSHVSMFSGERPYNHGVIDTEKSLRLDYPTVFQEIDSRTAVFGSNPYLHNKEYGIRQQFDVRKTYEPTIFSDNIRSHLRSVYNRWKREDHVLDQVVEWIDTQNDDWVVFANLMDAHAPYVPERYSNSSVISALRRNNTQYYDGFTLDGDRGETMNSLYKDCVLSLKYRIRSVLESLENIGVLDDTRVIISSDHGDGFGESNITGGSDAIFHYNSLNDDLLRLPLYEILPSMDEKKTVNHLSSIKRLPQVIRGGSFETKKTTSSVLFGGNIDGDDSYFGSWGKVLYRQSDDVDKYAMDSRGTWSNRDRSAEEIRNQISEAFPDTASSTLSTDRDDVKREVEENLEALGYK